MLKCDNFELSMCVADIICDISAFPKMSGSQHYDPCFIIQAVNLD